MTRDAAEGATAGVIERLLALLRAEEIGPGKFRDAVRALGNGNNGGKREGMEGWT